jgi:hypothetical protein
MTEQEYPVAGTPQIFALRPKEIVAIQFIPTNEGTDAILKWLEDVGRPFESWHRSTEVVRRGNNTRGMERLSIHLVHELGECRVSLVGGDWILLDEDENIIQISHTQLNIDYEKVEPNG